MALHRDIFWVGRQWAVTGYGLQAIDQKQKSKFDIEVDRLWDDELQENIRAQPWFNAEDFNKGLSVARARYPQAPLPAAPPAAMASLPNEHNEPIKVPEPAPEVGPQKVVVAKNFTMRVERWPAKFLALWRVRTNR